MRDIVQMKHIIEEGLTLLDFSFKPAELANPIEYILSLGGKRMRPILTLMGAELFGLDAKEVLPQALAVEVFHNFTLLHDDIMDEAPLRRGKETVHQKWNTNIAILAGDAMMVQAYQHLMQAPTEQVKLLAQVFNKTAFEVCQGQQYDMNFETQDNVQISDYIQMITWKTSVLLGCALQLGAIRAGASFEDQELIYDFGLNIGIAFQLQDDILDVYADPEKFGKQVGGDILSNKKTYLLLKAQELATGAHLDELNKWLEAKDYIPEEKVAAVTSIFNQVNIRSIAEKEMQHYYQKGLTSMKKLSIDDTRKHYLLAFAESLMEREV